MEKSEDTKISIIIPAYNAGKFMERCAVSLFEQTFKEAEYVLVDDGSSDNTVDLFLDVASRYPHVSGKIKIIRHEERRNNAISRLDGIRAASGKYIMQVDADDILPNDAAETFWKIAAKTDADIVWSDYCFLRGGKEFYVNSEAPENGKELTEAILEQRLHPAFWNKMIRKTLFHDISVPEIEKFRNGFDFLMVVQLFARAGKVRHIGKSLYHYIHNPHSVVNTNVAENFWRDMQLTCIAEDLLPHGYEKSFAVRKWKQIGKLCLYEPDVKKLEDLLRTSGLSETELRGVPLKTEQKLLLFLLRKHFYRAFLTVQSFLLVLRDVRDWYMKHFVDRDADAGKNSSMECGFRKEERK